MSSYANLFLFVVAFIGFGILGCSDKAPKNDSIWGGQGVSQLVDENYYQFFWQVSGHIPPKIKSSSLSKNKSAEWQYATILVVQQSKKIPYAFPFETFHFSPEMFSVEKNSIDFSSIASQKVIFYTDEQGNVRQLFVDYDNFDFFKNYSETIATPSEVVLFWEELQAYNSKSTIFWHNLSKAEVSNGASAVVVQEF